METTFLKLLFSIIIFTLTDCDTLDDLEMEIEKNCSFISGQISTDVIPLKYVVELKIQPDIKLISGITDITIYVKEPTTYISLHARNLKVVIGCIKIIKFKQISNCRADSAYPLLDAQYCIEDDILLLIFVDSIPRGPHILHIEHTSSSEKLDNLIYSYTRVGTEKTWWITNLYAPNSTRRLFPSWDDPIHKTTFRIIIHHNILFKVFSNKPAWHTSTNILETKLQLNNSYFEETHPMSTNLLVITLIPFNIIKYSIQSGIHSLWHFNYMKPDNFKFAQIIANNSTVNLPWVSDIKSKGIPKINHIAFPNSPMKSAGKPGLIIYREKDITYNSVTDFDGRKIDVAKLVTYEIARQLFVGYVGMNLNNSQWLNEILSSFYAHYALYQIWGERILQLFVVQNLQTALDSEVFLELEPIMYKAKEDVGIDGLLYPLLYHKKAFAIIHMFVYYVTPRNFDKIMRNYTSSCKYYLWEMMEMEHLQAENDIYNVRELIEPWLIEKHHPEILFIRDYKQSTVKFHQIFSSKIFENNILITYTSVKNITSYDIVQMILYNGTHTVLIDGPDPDHFFIANVKHIGYYRVNYDDRNWLLLSTYLQSENSTHIPVLNRAQIVNDAFHFVTTYNLESAVFYDVIYFLKNETNYIVWYPMFNILSYMSTYLELPNGKRAKINFLNILDGLLQNVGYEKRQGDDSMMESLRLLAIKWACKLGHAGCRNAIAYKMKAYIRDMYNSSIIPSWANWMYCTGMMAINKTEWKKAWLDGIDHKNIELLEHLSCSENKTIIKYYLNKMLKTNFGWKTNLHVNKIYISVVKKHVKKNIILSYILNRYKIAIERFFDDVDNGTLISNIVLNVHSEEHLNKISLFTTKTFLTIKSFTIYKWILERRKQIRRVINKFRMF